MITYVNYYEFTRKIRAFREINHYLEEDYLNLVILYLNLIL
jgi:uncharacterized protein YlbG (UPF0298 family)